MTGEKILFVDDEMTICKLMVSRLKSKQYEVESVSSGKDVLARAKVIKPNLIILDQQMPEITGVEVCKKLKADAELKDIPVVFFTGNPQMDLEKQCIGVGALGIIYKPEVGALIKIVGRILAGEEIDWGQDTDNY
ncbi:MAG: response regulator [Candidatus Omnitrophota bacterium]|nr:response regulator [Candidatus Omnitrophota bacterium]